MITFRSIKCNFRIQWHGQDAKVTVTVIARFVLYLVEKELLYHIQIILMFYASINFYKN